MHPSWITGMEALNAYGDWVSSFVLPIAFQWIDEHKAEVYASVPEELKDDVGVVIAAAFRLVRELPEHKGRLAKSAAFAAETAGEGHDPATSNPLTINPIWTELVQTVRASTEEAFKDQAPLLGDVNEEG